MQKPSKKRIYSTVITIIVYIALIFLIPHVKTYIHTYNDLKDRMYNDFEDFGKSLEDFNTYISRILLLEDYKLNDKNEYISRDIVRNFRSSGFDAESLGKFRLSEDYSFMYLNSNNVINRILEDEKLSIGEKQYLETLYEYNQELIKDYKNIIGTLYYKNWDFEKLTEVRKNIVSIYDDFSLKADNLLNSSEYSFLKDFKGAFKNSDVDFQEVKAYCDNIFSTFVKDQTLDFNNRDELNSDKYIFTTYEERDLSKGFDRFDRIDYRVEYDKSTKTVEMSAVSWSVSSKDRKYKEDELDSMVNEVIQKFNTNAINYEKEVTYDDEDQLDRISYSYIVRNNDIYDEMQKIHLEIQAHGLITNFTIQFPLEKETILPNVQKERILDKLNQEADIFDVLMIRSIYGNIEYEVHLIYNDTPYAAVFDGDNGNLKSYGRNLRNYNNSVEASHPL